MFTCGEYFSHFMPLPGCKHCLNRKTGRGNKGPGEENSSGRRRRRGGNILPPFGISRGRTRTGESTLRSPRPGFEWMSEFFRLFYRRELCGHDILRPAEVLDMLKKRVVKGGGGFFLYLSIFTYMCVGGRGMGAQTRTVPG